MDIDKIFSIFVRISLAGESEEDIYLGIFLPFRDLPNQNIRLLRFNLLTFRIIFREVRMKNFIPSVGIYSRFCRKQAVFFLMNYAISNSNKKTSVSWYLTMSWMIFWLDKRGEANDLEEVVCSCWGSSLSRHNGCHYGTILPSQRCGSNWGGQR